MYVHERLQLGKHLVQNRRVPIEVPLETLDEYALHSEQYEAVMLFRQYELVNVFLAFYLLLVVIAQS